MSLLLLLMSCLSGCYVAKLDADGKPILPQTHNDASLSNMTPDQVAQQLWPTKVVAVAESSAKNWQQLRRDQAGLQQGEKVSGFYRLSGVVSKVDRSHLMGQMVVDVEQTPVTVQIGPIIRGNAIRDAVPGLSFDTFKNQVQFARLAKELNKKALASFPAPDEQWQGQPITMIVAATLTSEAIIQAVPLALSRENAHD